ncbi:MAG: hypothetical protein ACREPL_13990 [Rhodanobacteraceae bacterium]
MVLTEHGPEEAEQLYNELFATK